MMVAPPIDTTVQSVVVTVQKPQFQTLIDRKVYTIGGDLQATTGSAADVLNNIPSVEVDADGTLSLRGDTAVTVLVDGKPSAQLSGPAAALGLLQYPASAIEKIEVMTNPPPQYKVDGSGGVINIITRKSRAAGWSGTVQLSLGGKRRFVSGVNVDYKAGPLMLSGGISLRQDAKQRRITDSRTETDPATAAVSANHETLNEQLRRLTPLVKGGVDWRLNDRQSLGASIAYHEMTGDRFFDQQNTRGPPGLPVTAVTDRHSDGYEWNKNADVEAHFEQKLGHTDETLSLALRRSLTRERERYAYLNTYPLPDAAPTGDHLHLSIDLVTTELSADYVLPLPQDRSLKLGIDLETNHNQFDNFGDTVDPTTGTAATNPDITNHFRYRQDISAVYADYQSGFGRWRWQTGLRLEQTETRGRALGGPVSTRLSYLRAYPSLHLDRDLSEQSKLTLSVSRRVNRPDAEALNPYSDHQDIHNLRAGNPELRPQDTVSAEVGYSYDAKGLSYSVTGYYRFTRNAFTSLTQAVGPDVVLTTGANLPRSRSGGAEFTASGKLSSQLSAKLSGNLVYSQIDATAIGGDGLRSSTGLNLKGSLDFHPTKQDTGQISFTRSDRRLTAQGTIRPVNILNLGYRRQIGPTLALVATYADALNGQSLHRTLTAFGLQDDYQRRQLGRIGYLGLVYTFGSTAKAKGPGFDYDP
jgi:outer membrane receptor protein involved in Fe transport